MELANPFSYTKVWSRRLRRSSTVKRRISSNSASEPKIPSRSNLRNSSCCTSRAFSWVSFLDCRAISRQFPRMVLAFQNSRLLRSPYFPINSSSSLCRSFSNGFFGFLNFFFWRRGSPILNHPIVFLFLVFCVQLR